MINAVASFESNKGYNLGFIIIMLFLNNFDDVIPDVNQPIDPSFLHILNVLSWKIQKITTTVKNFPNKELHKIDWTLYNCRKICRTYTLEKKMKNIH